MLQSPQRVFCGRRGVSVEDMTTFELISNLVGNGFKEVSDPTRMAKLKGSPYTGRRGPSEGKVPRVN